MISSSTEGYYLQGSGRGKEVHVGSVLGVRTSRSFLDVETIDTHFLVFVILISSLGC